MGAVLGVLALAGCSGTSPLFGGGEDELQPGYEETVDDQYVEPEPPAPPAENQQEPATWSCFLSVTYNDDWHDDVLCRRGIEEQRPYLREWDDFVEEWEILESAREYEAQLNAAG